jgi:hypothetical protein
MIFNIYVPNNIGAPNYIDKNTPRHKSTDRIQHSDGGRLQSPLSQIDSSFRQKNSTKKHQN